MPATAPDAASSPLSETPSSARASPEVEAATDKAVKENKPSKKGGSAKAKAAKVAKVVIPPHRPWREIISVRQRRVDQPFLPLIIFHLQECIASHPDEARIGVSRQVIKKYAEDVYHLDSTAKANVGALTRAINAGVASRIFNLPKGISGKIKLSNDKSNAKYKAIVKATKTPTVRTAKASKAEDPKPTRKRATTAAPPSISPEPVEEEDVEEAEDAEDPASVAPTSKEEVCTFIPPFTNDFDPYI